MNFTESYAVHFCTNAPSNLTDMVPVIAMEGIVSCYHIRKQEITWHRAYILSPIKKWIKSWYNKVLMTNNSATNEWSHALLMCTLFYKQAQTLQTPSLKTEKYNNNTMESK